MATPQGQFDVLPEDVNAEASYLRPVSMIEAGEASLRISAEGSTLMGAQKLRDHQGINTPSPENPEMTPEELKQAYPEFAPIFTENMTRAGADYAVATQKRIQEQNALIERGPQGPLASTIKFGAGLIPHVLDPVNLATGFGAGALMGKMAMGARASKVLAQGTFARSMTEGVAGNLLTEPVSAYASRKNLEEYGATDFFMNTFVGTLALGGTLHLGGRAINKIEPHLRAATHDASFKQVVHDNFPDINPIVKQYAEETNVKVPNGGSTLPVPTEYRHAKFTPDAPPKMYIASVRGDVGNLELDGTNRLNTTPYMGDGIYMSDNVVVANNSAAGSFRSGPSSGKIMEVDLGSSKILNLDDKLPDHVQAKILEIPEIAKLIKPEEIATGKSIMDLLETKIENTEVAREVSNKIKESGFDGFVMTRDKNIIGGNHEPHNVAVIFDPKKLTETQRFGVDDALVRRPSQDDLNSVLGRERDPKSKLGYSEADAATLQGLYKMAENPKLEPRELDLDIDERIKAFQSQEKIENMPPEARAEYEALKELKQGMEAEKQAWLALEECIKGG